MHIIEYSRLYGLEKREGYFAIPYLDRDNPSVSQFISLAGLDVVLTRPTAFLYIDGVSFSPSDAGIGTTAINPSTPVIKTTSSHMAHSWVRSFRNKEHLVKVDTISSTCAAGIQAIHEANRLIVDGTVKEVIIIGCERISGATLKLFSELNIPITCGDGFVYMRLEAGLNIRDIQWKYQYKANLFEFSKSTLDTLQPDYRVDYVKLHGTGTPANTIAESGLASIANNIVYKDKIGHTQGLSSLLETCLVLEDNDIKGRVLVTANGMGGYYGAFTLVKS